MLADLVLIRIDEGLAGRAQERKAKHCELARAIRNRKNINVEDLPVVIGGQLSSAVQLLRLSGFMYIL